MNLTDLIFSLIDFRSFSNLWYWIALAVTWSTASHWVLGVPYDMVLRAKRTEGQALTDLNDIVRVNLNRLLYIADEAGAVLASLASFALTTLGLLGVYYHSELAQAVLLLVGPLMLVGWMSVRSARRIRAGSLQGEALFRALHWHRVRVQIVGVIAIFVTAMWGMFQNFTLQPFG